MKVDTAKLRGLAKFTRGEAGRYCPAADNLEAAADLIDRLPKTLDDVPIAPGMTLWPPILLDNPDDENGGTVIGFIVILRDDAAIDSKGGGPIELDQEEAERCYSTREAAEAAAKQASQ